MSNPAYSLPGYNTASLSTFFGFDRGGDVGFFSVVDSYVKVENSTGATLPAGTVVGFAGVGDNNNISVTPYLADGTTSSLYILGVISRDLEDSGSVGCCCTFGKVGGFDTTGGDVSESWSVGDVLYASPTTAGKFTNVKPTASDNVIPIAAVLEVDDSDGTIFVRPTIEQQRYYGEFSKTTDQSPAAINTAYTLTFDNTEIGNGISIGTPASKIVTANSGLYQFDATLQLTSNSSNAKDVWVWFRKNGSNVANSSRLVTTDINDGYVTIALSEFFSLAANDYIELVFASDSTDVTFDSVASTAFAPASPAILLAVTQIVQ